MSNSVFSTINWGRPITSDQISNLGDLKVINLNLLYLIKETILPVNGYTNQYTETLQAGQQSIDPNTGLPVTPYQGTYKDWVYFNPDVTNPSLTGILIPPAISNSGNLAYIDYPNGTVYYSGLQTNPINITYDYYSVFVQPGYPDWGFDQKTLETLPSPAVSIDFAVKQNISFAIGGIYKDIRTFVINVTAASDSQRDDLNDILEDSLRLPINNTIDYNQGYPLNFNGDINQNFDRTKKWKPLRQVTEITSKAFKDPKLPDKLRHQANLNMTIYTV